MSISIKKEIEFLANELNSAVEELCKEGCLNNTQKCAYSLGKIYVNLLLVSKKISITDKEK